MFDEFTDTQAFADAVKQMVLNAKSSSEQRADALKAISQFEKFGWQPETMQYTLDELDISGFHMNGDQLTYDQPDMAALVIDVLLNRYMKKMQGLDSQVYTAKEAAVYLGVSMAQLEDYVFNQQLIKPIRRGDALVFGRELLEAYKKPKTSQETQSKFEG